MKPFILLILLLSYHTYAKDSPNRRINLDDIERDNILSEKLAKNNDEDDIYDVQQAHAYQSKNIEYYRQQLKQLKELQEQQEQQEKLYVSSTQQPPNASSGPSSAAGGVIYATAATPTQTAYVTTASPNIGPSYYTHRYSSLLKKPESQQVQYVTISPNRNYQYQIDDTSIKAVLDDSSNTLSASSRDRLAARPQPITPTVSAYYEHYRQPQYVYVQSNRIQPKAIQFSHQQQQPAAFNDIQYAATAPGASDDEAQNTATPATITYNHDEDVAATGPSRQQVAEKLEQDEEQSQQHEAQAEDYQQAVDEQQQGNIQYQQQGNIQYVPYIAQGPNQQSYITMVAIPTAHGQNLQPIRYTPSIITYSHSGPAAITPVVGGLTSNIQYLQSTAQPTGALQYVNTNDLTEAPPAIQYATAYQQDIQYADPQQTPSGSAVLDGSKQFKYAPKPEHRDEIYRQPTNDITAIQYVTSQRVVPLLQQIQYVPQSQQQINVQPIHHFQAYREPKSLLDSYVPSWVILEQQKRRQQYLLQQQRQRSLNPQTYQQSSSLIPQHSQYNTIAYSTSQGVTGFVSTNHIKRAVTKLTKVDSEKDN